MQSSSRVLAAALLAVSTSARAGMVCDTLATTAHYAALASKKITTALMYDPFNACHNNVEFHAGLCCTNAQLAATPIFDSGAPFASGLTALAVTKTAVGIGPNPPGATCSQPYIEGDLATGGGVVVSAYGLTPGQTGVIDTTGTHPALGACTQALADALAASTAFAAMTPTQVFDKVIIQPGQVLDLVVSDGEVVQMKQLNLVRGPYSHPDQGTCPGLQSKLRISGLGPGEKAVINVTATVSIGDCSVIENSEFAGVVINASGPGSVRFGISVDNQGAAILAPLRTIGVKGPGNPAPSRVNNLWGKSVQMSGNVDVFPAICP